jgi:hypothetical protein
MKPQSTQSSLNDTRRKIQASVALAFVVGLQGCGGSADMTSTSSGYLNDIAETASKRRNQQSSTKTTNSIAIETTPTPTSTSTSTSKSTSTSTSETSSNRVVQPLTGTSSTSETSTGSTTALMTPQSVAPAPLGIGDYCSTGTYPSQWIWSNSTRSAQPQAASESDGAPMIKQIRNGVVIATYTSLGGSGASSAADGYLNPQGSVEAGALHRATYRNWADGDIFEVYPAVYSTSDQQPYIGPAYDNYSAYLARQMVIPKNIVIRGVTVNGKRPVIKMGSGVSSSNNTLGQGLLYIDRSENVTIENLDIQQGSADGRAGKAGIYVNGARNLTINNVRVSGFKASTANGIFGTSANSGTLRLNNVELIDNGGDSGPEHNIYINASSTDPAFTVHMTNSFSTSVYYGHTFKSRAQRNVIEGNYFMGTRQLIGARQTESYLIDIPEGGDLVVRNNILVKDYSGDNSNGASITYFAPPDGRKQSIQIEHNTFVGFTKYYDTQSHPLYPMMFYYPQKVPGTADFGVSDVRIANNLFVGYCKTTVDFMNFRGTDSLSMTFSDINMDFSLKNPLMAQPSNIIGTPSYSHDASAYTRTKATVGARD